MDITLSGIGGVVMLGALILTMNYNHPYTEDAQKLVVGIPVVPQVTGVVSEVTDKINTPIKKGDVLFKIDPARYKAKLEKLEADIVTAKHDVLALEEKRNSARLQLEQARLNVINITKLSALPERQSGKSEPIYCQ